MRRRRPTARPDDQGHDSFLDIVANLVGILIILIMVIGARATDAMVEVVPEPDETVEQVDVEAPKAAAAALLKDLNQDLQGKIKRQQVEIRYRQLERDKILLGITAMEKTVEQFEQDFTEEQQAHLAVHEQLLEAQQQLQQIEQTRFAVENSTSTVGKIDHLPTPMAKTVFGKELHFRLHDQRLAYIPWDEFVERLKEEATQKLWKLKDAPQITETAGPLGGFRMRYTLHRVDYPVETRVGVAQQRRIELDHFDLIPVSPDVGEPVSDVWNPTSQFRSLLDAHDPRQTTITVWVYPDSFQAYRELKQKLFEKGYLSACRPLPEGHHVGGSPRGTRSSSQ